jgi:threonine dehydrogenase-like Zn-dependent dehydrogenase
MKALSLLRPGTLAFVDTPEPQLGPEDVLIAVGYVGLCGTDLNAYRGLSPMVAYPRIVGHEISGVVAGIGRNVPADIQVGARVTLSPYSHCGACRACRIGRTNACEFNRTLGVQRDGSLTERIAVNYQKVYSSDMLSLEELALVEPLAVGYHAANRGRVGDADTVLVLGCGAVGLGAIAAAASKGATVIGADVERSKLDIATKLGAGHVVNAATEDVGGRVATITDGEGASVVIEAAGQPETTRTAIEVAASAARVVLIGYASTAVDLDTTLIVKKELEVLGSRNALDEFRSVIAMLEQRERPFRDMITTIVPLGQTAEAFADWSASPQSFTKILVRVGAQ